MQTAKSLIKEGWGDPNWDYDYMNYNPARHHNFDVWQDMKKTWDGVPEKKAVAAYVVQQNSCRPEKKLLIASLSLLHHLKLKHQAQTQPLHKLQSPVILKE